MLGNEVRLDTQRCATELELLDQCQGIDPAGPETEQEERLQGLRSIAGELASWRVGELASWRAGELASWRVGELVSW
ncbi:MAG: hypothetical protein D4R97_00315 [Bacteroidetes bacterium]|nr:MAG: hypothetical protein D4R97_00315 [Bacteroidota bacterium]